MILWDIRSSVQNVLERVIEKNYNPPSHAGFSRCCRLEGKSMRKRFIGFWRDNSGAVSVEWMLVASVLVLGSIAALAATKVALFGNVEELAKAVAGM
jgi:Flp pilus assembly pilin Flp